jgi:hypothetical protein
MFAANFMCLLPASMGSNAHTHVVVNFFQDHECTSGSDAQSCSSQSCNHEINHDELIVGPVRSFRQYSIPITTIPAIIIREVHFLISDLNQIRFASSPSTLHFQRTPVLRI